MEKEEKEKVEGARDSEERGFLGKEGVGVGRDLWMEVGTEVYDLVVLREGWGYGNMGLFSFFF